jgi:thiol-disulfide isomerase/thioredoxin
MDVLNRFGIYTLCLCSILTVQLNAQPSKSKIQTKSQKNITGKFPNTIAGETALLDEISRIEAAADEFVTYEDLSNAERNASRNKNAVSVADLKKLSEVFEKQKATLEIVRQLRWEFIKRPVHFDKAKLANAYYLLLSDVPYDPRLNDAQLDEIIKGLIVNKQYAKFEVNYSIASTLNSNKNHHPNSIFNPEAETYARKAISETEEKIRKLPEKEVSEKAISMRAEVLSLLGHILSEKGNLVEAEAMLLKTQNLLPADSENIRIKRIYINKNIRLARLYTQKKQYEKAEEHYLKASVRYSNEWMNFEDLYKARNDGKTEGFEDYFQKISEKISLKLKEEVISKRIKNPQDAVPFELETIKGNKLSLSDLKGKVVVINLWGTWCSPCVRELPELQQIYEKYKDDKEVAVITMDADDDLEKVKKFVADKKYSFPVLLGDSYKDSMKYYGSIIFPTTLFIGRKGKIDYIKIGNSPKLFEEFDWRIQALKEDL